MAKAWRLNPTGPARAREIYFYLSANGWEKTLAEFKPKPAAKVLEPIVSVGDFIREVRTASPRQGRTLEDYIRSFRRIVADIFGIDGGFQKYDYRSGGRQQWLERVDAVPLEKITPALVQKWKLDAPKRD